jgi:outer membrane protein, heavy metal efflux system
LASDGIAVPLQPPALPPAPLPQELPATTMPTLGPPIGEQSIGPGPVLQLEAVLDSVDSHFPLIFAAEMERALAAGQRLSAEGAFDFNLKSRGTFNGGTFDHQRFDLYGEQATLFHGVSAFGGYRLGYGDYPVYYGQMKTADGGEFRAGVQIPLLKDAAIDRRRANLRQAWIAQNLAEPAVQRARIDAHRGAAKAFWNWVAAGQNVQVAQRLLKIARDRQAGLEAQFKKGQISEFVVIDNRRLIAEREGAEIASERRLQLTALELSLFLRDGKGDPVVPHVSMLPADFAERQPAAPDIGLLRQSVATAFSNRPELERFRLLRERTAVELQLARNQALPGLNAILSTGQDVGAGKKGEGIFALDRTNAEASIFLDVPLQRRDARGKQQIADATMAQLLAQERYVRDQISVEVQDAFSNLDKTNQRLAKAREEQQVAQRVAELERDRFSKGQGTLLEVNFRELAAAAAQAKVIDTLADFYRAQADLEAAMGMRAKDSIPPAGK